MPPSISLDRFRVPAVLAGPLLGLVMYLILPARYDGLDGETIALSHAARATLAVVVWMATWWLTEAIDIAATALLPVAVFPLLGVMPISRAAAPYGSELIFLFMGGFILALSLQRWQLDRRIALFTLRIVGSKPANIIGGFMLVTFVIGMWVSNTATAAMMVPIAVSVIYLLRSDTDAGDQADQTSRRFAVALMLGIAYAASISGVTTIIGSPPNGILVQFVELQYGREIGFAQWMLIGVPLAIVFLPITWLLLTRVIYPVGETPIRGGPALFDREFRKLGPMKRGEWVTMVVFAATALLWITRPLLASIVVGTGSDARRLFAGLSDPGIAICAGLALFLIPVAGAPSAEAPAGRRRKAVFAMDWQTAVKLPWGILVLFGGGLSLAAAIQATGVAEFLAAQARGLGGVPPIVVVLAVTTGVMFLTELTSNTATAATLVPVLAGLAPGLGVGPEMLLLPAIFATSCAFMMPVATPPNAIVFGSGFVSIREMVKAGFWLSLIGIVLIVAALYLLVIPVLGTFS